MEASALGEVFGSRQPVVTSVKGAIGEASASAMAGLAAAVLCGRRGEVPPIAGLATVDPACVHLNLATHPSRAPGPVALVNGIASGGALAAAIVRVLP